MKFLRLFASVFILFLIAQPLIAQSGQVVKDKVLTDHDYKFQLINPKDGNLLPEKDAQKLVPDAVAGAVVRRGLYLVVIVEKMSEGDPKSWALALAENLPSTDKVQELFEETKFQGKDAVRMINRVTANGTPIRFQHIVFFSDGHLFQLVSWGVVSPSTKNGAAFKPIINGFKLLPGKITKRNTPQRSNEVAGIGWELKKDRYRSAPYGFSVIGKKGWRLIAGDELTSMNSDAEVAMMSDLGTIMVVAESCFVSKEEQEAQLKGRRDAFLEIPGVEPKDGVIEHMISGVKVAFAQSTSSNPDFGYLHGAFFHGDAVLQITVSYPIANEKALKKVLAGALSAIYLMSEDERLSLEKTMAKQIVLHSRVGPLYSWVEGTFRHFEHGFSWARPLGFWNATYGDELKLQDEEASLALSHPKFGVYCLMFANKIADEEIEGSHLAVISQYGYEPSKTKKVEINGREFLKTTVVGGGEKEFTFELYSTYVGGRAFDILFWSYHGNLKKGQAAVASALKGFDFQSTIKPVHRQIRGTFTDYRLRFSLSSPAPNQPFKNSTPKAIQGIASIVSTKSGSGDVTALALCSTQDFQDEEWFKKFLTDTFVRRMKNVYPGEPTKTESKMANRACSLLTWESGRRKMQMRIVARNGLYYAVIIEGIDIDKLMKSVDTFRLL